MKVQNLSSGSREIPSLYVLKGVSAILVVLLHTSVGDYTHFVNLLPVGVGITSVFYAITGYFLYTADEVKLRSNLWRTMKKTIPIILITQTVYTLFSLPLPEFTMENKIFYFKWIILGDGGALWYLTALLQGLFVFWVLVRLLGAKYIPLLLLGIVVRFVCEDYWVLIFETPRTNLEKNFLAYSLPMLAAGYLIHKYEEKLLQKCNYFLVFTVLAILIYVNEYWLKSVLPSYISLHQIMNAVASSVVVLMALQWKSFGRGTAIAFVGKNLSANIYYWHGLFIMFFTMLQTSVNIDYYSWSFFYVLLSTMLFAYIVYWIQKKTNVKIL